MFMFAANAGMRSAVMLAAGAAGFKIRGQDYLKVSGRHESTLSWER